jgi:Mn-dependent DtxR family transcriptional regulator
MSTLDLVSAIINKDATGIETAFNDTMAEKISARLDDMRTDVAQTMFKQEEPEAAVEEEYETDKATGMKKKKKTESC